MPNGNASVDCNIFVAALFSPPTSVLLFSFGFCSFCSEVEGSRGLGLLGWTFPDKMSWNRGGGYGGGYGGRGGGYAQQMQFTNWNYGYATIKDSGNFKAKM